ncbi:MAG: hypothetical protein NUV77_05695 [Thermoguttaceae bacterium]|jgi:hypothetical protein|nr:hypothetical protein [Thermoguttaceae bacterium]
MADICPIYKWMNFGSYCSYYALHCPNCDQPCSWDGPCDITTANCAVRPCTGCSKGAIPAERSAQFQLAPEVLEGGIRPYPTCFEIAPGVTIKKAGKKTRVRVVRFNRQPGPEPQEKCLARVFLVRLDPQEFDLEYDCLPPGGAPVLDDLAVGYEIDPKSNLKIDRDVQKGEVETFDAMGFYRGLRVLIHKPSNTWREYRVVLANPEAFPVIQKSAG